jgi:hypothetical protein
MQERQLLRRRIPDIKALGFGGLAFIIRNRPGIVIRTGIVIRSLPCKSAT